MRLLNDFLKSFPLFIIKFSQRGEDGVDGALILLFSFSFSFFFVF
jgi:hypothetical protein